MFLPDFGRYFGFWAFCNSGRFVTLGVLQMGVFYHWAFFIIGRFVALGVLFLGILLLVI